MLGPVPAALSRLIRPLTVSPGSLRSLCLPGRYARRANATSSLVAELLSQAPAAPRCAHCASRVATRGAPTRRLPSSLRSSVQPPPRLAALTVPPPRLRAGRTRRRSPGLGCRVPSLVLRQPVAVERTPAPPAWDSRPIYCRVSG